MRIGFKRLLALLMLCLAVNGASLPVQAGDYMVAVVSVPDVSTRLHLRAEPKTGAESLGLYYTGTVVTVYHQTNHEWWQVEIGSRKGYMQAKFLVPCGLQSGYDTAVLARVGDSRPVGVVNNPNPNDRLNLRDRPSETANSYGKFYNGTKVIILGVCGDWYHVIVDDGGDYVGSGFMLARYVRVGGVPDAPVANVKGRYAVVNNPNVADRLNLRVAASETSASLGKFYNGTTVEVVEELGTWSKVRVNNTMGYMIAKYLVRDSAYAPIVTVTIARIMPPSGGASVLRAGPSESAAAVRGVDTGEWSIVEVFERAGTWYRVQIGQTQGYLPTNALLTGSLESSTRMVGTVSNPNARDRLHLREQPTQSARSLGQYFNGTQVLILDANAFPDNWPNWRQATGWYHVQVGGKTGYMQAKYISPMMGANPANW